MRKQLLIATLLILVLLLAPAALPALAQATSTPTPTATNTATATATATSTNTSTPMLIVTGVTSQNQGYEVRRYISAGDVAITLAYLVGLGLFVFMILLDQRQRA